MSKEKINYGAPKKCEDEFECGLGRFKKIAYNEKTQVYLYSREITYPGCVGLIYYEVFKARRIKNYEYDCYPSTSQFGNNCKCTISLKKAIFYLNNGF